ncbi:MAG: cobalamin biosynthesis protein CbiL [Candidatus Adiutrix sp.]|nr:cobalamin biosynthesis protein CbiL [Candidatus Adiutrix sp.]
MKTGFFRRRLGRSAAWLLGFLLILAAGRSAEAHSVFIFAWVDAGRICTESYFTKKSRVRGGRVSMRDLSGNTLESGVTDEEGLFCFKPPDQREGLLFVVEAGEGHRAEFRLRAEDLPPPEAAVPAGPEADSAEASALPAPPGLSADLETRLRNIVREELRAQLGPINRALAESENAGEPGLREIVGGLGWLAGLAGLAFWLAGRRKRA